MKQAIRILIIDDEQTIIEALTELLELEDFQVDTFLDAQQALDSLNKNSPVVVLCDVKMPKMEEKPPPSSRRSIDRIAGSRAVPLLRR